MHLHYTALILLVLACSPVFGTPVPAELKVPVILENNTAQNQAVILIWNSPLQFGNNTEQLTLVPGERITRRYPVGTKLYRASEQEAGIVMGGWAAR